MKINFMATLVAAFAAGFQTLAAISSLPIGSVEKVLNHELLHTDMIDINVQVADDVAALNEGNVSIIFMDTFRYYVRPEGRSKARP